MTKLYMRLLALICSLLLLSACAEKTPQEVTELFWHAVISNNVEGAVKYSTLGETRDYDGFGRNWSGYSPSLGKIVIDGDEATVTTALTKSTNTGDETVTFETILIRQEGEWRVDYARTGKEVNSGPLGKLFGQIERMGKSLSEQFGATSGELTKEMERMGAQLATLSESIGTQATAIIEQHGEELRSSIEELADSVRRALEEQEKRLSDKDRQTLQEVADDLDEDSEQLDEPTPQILAESGKKVAVARQKLDAIDNEAIAPYQKQWRQWSEQFVAEMQKIVDEVSAQAKQ